MTTHQMVIEYPSDLLVSLKATQHDFEQEARILLAIKLYELGKVSSGMAATLAGVSRIAFFFILQRYNLSPIGVDAAELAQDVANA